MPPKAKITAEMIIEAAFELVREQGTESITARLIAQKLGCSTQPVMYYFDTVEDIRKAVYEKADQFHSEYITNIQCECSDPLTGIGLMYIRFAVKEKNLFRFLFQSNEFSGKSMTDLIDDQELLPVLEMFQQFVGTDMQQTKQVFLLVFVLVHGYASMFANNMMKYDEKVISQHLQQAMMGAIYAVKAGEK